MPEEPSATLLNDLPIATVTDSAQAEAHPQFVLHGKSCMVLPEEQLGPDLKRIGQIKLDGEIFIVAVAETLSNKASCLRRLTRREQEIAWLVAEGLFTKQIAHRLGVSPHTVNAYMNRIFVRLSVHNRAEMVAVLLRKIK